MNLRRPCSPASTGHGFAEEEIDKLLDDKRQARIGLALVVGSVITALGIIAWIVVALL